MKSQSSSGSNRVLISQGTYGASGNWNVYVSDAWQMDAYGNVGQAYEKFSYTFGSFKTLTNTFDFSTNNDELKMYYNGSLQVPTTSTPRNNTSNFSNGTLYIGKVSFGLSWDKDMVAILVYDSVLPTSDRQMVEMYLQNFYAHY
jgi:hypothetical protein